MISLRAPRCDDVVFLQGLSERVRHFKLKCVATLVTSSSSASRPSPLGLGGCLCIASTARTFTYRLIYSRTRAYQTRPAVELVSSKEGLSLPPPLFLLWVVRATLRTQVRPAIEFVSGKEDLRPRIAVFDSWYCSLRVQVFLEFVYWLFLNFASAPGLSGGRGEMAMAVASSARLAFLRGAVCACCTQYTRCCSFGPCTDAVHGAPGHNRWGVVETPLPVKTQGGTMNCLLNFVHRVLL